MSHQPTPHAVLRKRAVCTLLGISPAHLDRRKRPAKSS